MAGGLGGDEADAADVEVAVGLGESQALGQQVAHHVAVEVGHRAGAQFEQRVAQAAGDRGLARAGQAGEEDHQAAAVGRAGDVHGVGSCQVFGGAVGGGDVFAQLQVDLGLVAWREGDGDHEGAGGQAFLGA